MSGAETVYGEFWTTGNPKRRVQGEFTAEAGKEPSASLAGRLADDPQQTTAITPGDMAAVMAAQPRGRSRRFSRSRCMASYIPVRPSHCSTRETTAARGSPRATSEWSRFSASTFPSMSSIPRYGFALVTPVGSRI